MINPNIVEGQIAGGTAQGIAGVLYEHLAYDDDGNPVATTFMDYLVPTAAEIPHIEFGHVDTPGPAPAATRASAKAASSVRCPRSQRGRRRALTVRCHRHRLPLTPSSIRDLIAAAVASEASPTDRHRAKRDSCSRKIADRVALYGVSSPSSRLNSTTCPLMTSTSERRRAR